MQISGHKSKQFVERAKAESTPMLGRAQGRDRIDKLKMRYGWNTMAERRYAYTCADGLLVKVVSRAFKRGQFVDRFGNRK